MRRIEFHPEADREIADAQAWYRERSDVAAQAFALEIDRGIKNILTAGGHLLVDPRCSFAAPRRPLIE